MGWKCWKKIVLLTSCIFCQFEKQHETKNATKNLEKSNETETMTIEEDRGKRKRKKRKKKENQKKKQRQKQGKMEEWREKNNTQLHIQYEFLAEHLILLSSVGRACGC